jgi:hypothetical protein
MTRRKYNSPQLLLTLIFTLCAISALAQTKSVGPRSLSAQNKPVVIPEVSHAITPPLRDIPPVLPTNGSGEEEEHRVIPVHPLNPRSSPSTVQDPVWQQFVVQNLAATQGLNFEGISTANLTGGIGAPPDTNGAVGATQYVQTVNTALAVFDKNTGALVLSARDISTLFTTMGGKCAMTGESDPVVVYDKLANRWLIGIINDANGTNDICMAVSRTSDATGSYATYDVPFGSNLPDYPKWGTWSDAYYFSANIFGNGTPRACAFNRNAMLNAQPLQSVCFDVSAAASTLLPSDLDGTTAPPAGEPNFFVAMGNNSLQLFKFHVDFTNTANSTFTGPTTISVASFSQLCGGGTCVPQGGSTQQLDSLADRLMFRLAYRNFGDHETLVVNHSVTAGSGGGVRWYEIRSPNGTPTVFQQGTFAPDSRFRWMGSVATDHAGDIGVGYSLSSSSMNPAIAVTARTPSDPQGTLEAENVVFTGGGSQTPTLNRWGDYSAITVDPTDDCTFFYTTEYIPSNGNFNWHTRIVSFKMNNCGANANPDFTLSASPSSVTITQGTSGTSTITVNPINGFNGTVSLSASGLPSGVTASFNPSSTTGRSTLTLSASGTATTGSATVTVTGISGSLTHTVMISLTVNPAGGGGGPVPVNLSGAFNINPGIVTDGTTFSGGGFDNDGFAYSSNLLGSSVSFGGTSMSFGPANAADAVANATITLPSGQFASLKVLAAGVNGNQASQTFTVHFSDGTSQSFTQSVSDWAHPQNFAGETIVATTAHRDKSDGTTQVRSVNVFGYVFSLNSSKTVSSITLPATRNVVVLAMTLIPGSGGGGTQAQANLGGAFNREGIVTDGTTFTGGGLDGDGSAYSANLLGSTITFGGAMFTLGAANTSNDVSAAGQTITLPSGQFSSLRMLAAGVNGNQASQSFVVHFSDGTSSTFTQSISDWFTPQSFAGESTAVTMSHRNNSDGTADNRTFLLYGYSFSLNNAKTVSSITLPNNANVEVLAITLVP